MDTGKEKGYVLYDEVNELLAEELSGRPRTRRPADRTRHRRRRDPGRTQSSSSTRSSRRAEELGDLELVQEFSDKTNDPVRMYLREMGTVPLLTREGEIELAKRIERGQGAVRKALSRSPLVIREILAMPEMLRRRSGGRSATFW